MKLVSILEAFCYDMAMDDEQKKVCEKYGAGYHATESEDIIGVSRNINSGKMPINGLRHSGTHTTSGWYIWARGY